MGRSGSAERSAGCQKPLWRAGKLRGRACRCHAGAVCPRQGCQQRGLTPPWGWGARRGAQPRASPGEVARRDGAAQVHQPSRYPSHYPSRYPSGSQPSSQCPCSRVSLQPPLHLGSNPTPQSCLCPSKASCCPKCPRPFIYPVPSFVLSAAAPAQRGRGLTVAPGTEQERQRREGSRGPVPPLPPRAHVVRASSLDLTRCRL